MNRMCRHPARLACITILLLIQQGSIACSQDRQQRQDHLDRALFAAVNANDANTVISLLKQGANPNARAVLRKAAPFRVQIVHRIRSRKPRFSHEVTPLLFALMVKQDRAAIPYSPENIPLLRALLEHGANPNVSDADGETPLDYALLGGKDASIHLLLKYMKHGGDGSLDGVLVTAVMPPITHPGAPRGDASVVEDLLDHGANVNVRDSDGSTPLYDAIVNRDIDTIKVLLVHHANVSLRGWGGLTPLACAMKYRADEPEIIRLLKAAGAKK